MLARICNFILRQGLVLSACLTACNLLPQNATAKEISPQVIGGSGKFGCGFSNAGPYLVTYLAGGGAYYLSFEIGLAEVSNAIAKTKKKIKLTKQTGKKIKAKKLKTNLEKLNQDRVSIELCEKGITNSDENPTNKPSPIDACAKFEGPQITPVPALKIINGNVCGGASANVRIDIGGGSCSGTHIGIDSLGRSVVLTAAHCLISIFNPTGITVFAKNNSGNIQRKSAEFFINNTWNPYSYNIEVGDFGVIILNGALTGVPTIPPCKLPSALSVGSITATAGYGLNDSLNLDLQPRAATVKVDLITGNTIRATRVGTDQVFGTTCSGDSGGGIIGIENNNSCVMGATSWGTDPYCSATGGTDVAYWSNIASTEGQQFLSSTTDGIID